MADDSKSIKRRVYPTAVIAAGIVLWLVAAARLCTAYTLHDQLILIALVPLVVMTGMFPNTFPLPSGLKVTQERLTFTYSDALVLLVACWYGLPACVFIAGIEGFTSSRRVVRRFSSNLFSFSMMSLAAAAAAVTLSAVLNYGFGDAVSIQQRAFTAVAVAMLVASIVHIIINSALFSLLFSTRLGTPFIHSWKQNLLWTAPMFLPTSAAASLMFIALQHNALTMIVIGTPLLVAIHFGHRHYRDSVQEQFNLIERAQQERVAVTEKAHRETIEALAVAINAKDKVTHGHVLRVQIYAAGVAGLLNCNEGEIEALRAGALLHDIGKIAVPDYILNKPGKLTAAEFEKMKMHTIVGAQILGRVCFPFPVVPVVRHHHERWDGKGYPDGLSGNEIPLTARILSVVDCFDAVREDRQYRKAMTREAAIDFIMNGSGTMYDPQVVGTFITHLPEFEAQILAQRTVEAPTYGIGPVEQLSEAARLVAPAAGLAQTASVQKARELSHPELKLFYDLAQEMSSAADRGIIIGAFLERLPSIVPFDSCAIALAAPETGKWIVAYAAGQRASLLKGREISAGEGTTGWALANRRSFCNSDPRLDLPSALGEFFSDYRTLAVFPIIKGEELLGVVTLYSSALAAYTPDHERLLEEASKLLANALSAKHEALAALPLDAALTTAIALQNPSLKQTDFELQSELAH